MKRLLASLGMVVIVGACLLPAPALAHVLKEDEGISVVLHMPPDDNPQAGEQAEMDFSFGDDARSFSLPDCDCRVTIRQGSQTVQTSTLTPPVKGATLDGIVMATFPHGGAYDVVVDGTSRSDRFKTFQVRYVVRVASPDRQTSGQGSTVLIVSAGSLAILALVAFNSIREGGRYSSPLHNKQGAKKRHDKKT